MVRESLMICEPPVIHKCELIGVFYPVLIIFMAITMTRNIGAEETGALRMTQTIALPNVEGRIATWPSMLKANDSFIAALGNNSIEILDLNAGKHFKSIPGLYKPQGVSFIPEFNRPFVANGNMGACDILTGSSFARIIPMDES